MAGSNGAGGRGLPPSVARALQESAGHIRADLEEFYPLTPPEMLKKISEGLAQEQLNIQPLIETFVKRKETHWKMNLVRQPKVLELLGRPGSLEGLTLIAPMALENCVSDDEVLKTITILALLLTPSARAMLAIHGYKLQIGAGTRRPPETLPAPPDETPKD